MVTVIRADFTAIPTLNVTIVAGVRIFSFLKVEYYSTRMTSIFPSS